MRCIPAHHVLDTGQLLYIKENKSMKEKPVRDIQLRKGMNTDDLVNELFSSGGFTAKKVASGVNILEKMINDDSCVRFLSFPACII